LAQDEVPPEKSPPQLTEKDKENEAELSLADQMLKEKKAKLEAIIQASRKRLADVGEIPTLSDLPADISGLCEVCLAEPKLKNHRWGKICKKDVEAKRC
jgi:hypothetical protein